MKIRIWSSFTPYLRDSTQKELNLGEIAGADESELGADGLRIIAFCRVKGDLLMFLRAVGPYIPDIGDDENIYLPWFYSDLGYKKARS